MLIDTTQAVEHLRRGDLVALPTETVYGLAGRIDRDETLRKIFSTKGRPFFDPLIVHVGRIEEAKGLTSYWPEIYDVLTQSFWPGPLTLIAPKAKSVSSLITSGLETVALRCPRHLITLAILRELNIPLAAPSANHFGHTSPTSALHVESEFSKQIPVVDGGDCEIGVESTVLRAHREHGSWICEILRPGGVTRQQISEALTQAGFSYSMERKASTASPGHLEHHYQPESPIVLAPKETSEAVVLREIQKLQPSVSHLRVLRLDDDARQAARSLYQSFRELSAQNAAIFIPYSSQNLSMEWEAVWDRIERAATLKLLK